MHNPSIKLVILLRKVWHTCSYTNFYLNLFKTNIHFEKEILTYWISSNTSECTSCFIVLEVRFEVWGMSGFVGCLAWQGKQVDAFYLLISEAKPVLPECWVICWKISNWLMNKIKLDRQDILCSIMLFSVIYFICQGKNVQKSWSYQTMKNSDYTPA